jgi:hypothetical protein
MSSSSAERSRSTCGAAKATPCARAAWFVSLARSASSPFGGYVSQAGDSQTIVVADGGVIGRFADVPAGYGVNVVGKA